MDQLKQIEFRKSRDFGELINATFEFLRQNLKILFLSLIFIAGPGIILTGIAGGFRYGGASFNKYITGTAIIYFLLMLITLQLIITVTYSCLNLYIEKNSSDFSVNDVWNRTKEDFLMILVTTIGTGVVTLLGALLIIIPGIYLSVALTIIFMVRMREKLSFVDSVSRCRKLISGNWWFTFALLLILAVIQYFFSFIFAIPQYIVIFITAFHNSTGKPELNSTLLIITSIISSISYIFYCIPVIGITFHYFSLVEKKEAVGLLQKLETI
ncbi:MAG TPA: hypothetical protein VMT35_18065 [Ignavibacteriaceae bacterium]|nr:hypothetical protein [Ignavibacteriaceae bacterium]